VLFSLGIGQFTISFRRISPAGGVIDATYEIAYRIAALHDEDPLYDVTISASGDDMGCPVAQA
jgi:hypothetical protein